MMAKPTSRTNRWLQMALTLLCAYAGITLVLGISLAEFSLHLPRTPVQTPEMFQVRFQHEFHAPLQDVAMTAADGAVLRGWYIEPPIANGESVVLLHGISGNRVWLSSYADIFLRRGYAVLLPDSREHGASGGAIATYGILERDDVRRWVGWLRQREPGCTYLLGESMGAAIGLEATAVTPQLCAAAVESPYANFRPIAIERLGWETHFGSRFWATVGLPAIEVAIQWTLLRYRIWLPDASPIHAVEHSRVPVLLIAGTADEDIRMHNAQEIASACGSRCALWIVRGARHGEAAVVAPEEFHFRVANWFITHDPLANRNAQPTAPVVAEPVGRGRGR